MACDITKGRDRACKESIGGVSKLFLFNYLEDPFTVDTDLGECTAINAALTEVFEYELDGDGNPLVENLVSDRNTGTSVNTQTITAILKQIDAATSAEMNLLAYGYPQAVVKDRNGVYHAIGIDDGIDFTVDQTTGGAKTDLSGYTLTGISTVKGLSPKLDSSTITAFELLVAENS